jgi:triphosphoribosyl-dephospho-CoA synthase
MISASLAGQLACIWEATARKPGNVHRYQDFDDVTYLDFLVSAAAMAPVLDRAAQQSVGKTVLESVQATRKVATTNTNLGMVLLFAPLAAVGVNSDLRRGVEQVLSNLTLDDSRPVYQAIRLANPGGLGKASEQDVTEEPTIPLRQVMALAADRDLIARQYANGFQEIFQSGVPALEQGLETTSSLEGAIIHCHLQLLANYPDTLIARKRSLAEAETASRQAQQVLARSWPESAAGWQAFFALDAWLRTEGHGRNPGTTADLVAASLFVALREGRITLPHRNPWTLEFPS